MDSPKTISNPIFPSKSSSAKPQFSIKILIKKISQKISLQNNFHIFSIHHPIFSVRLRHKSKKKGQERNIFICSLLKNSFRGSLHRKKQNSLIMQIRVFRCFSGTINQFFRKTFFKFNRKGWRVLFGFLFLVQSEEVFV